MGFKDPEGTVLVKITIELSEAQATRLQEEAARLGVQPADLARAALIDLLADHDDFRAAAPSCAAQKRGTLPSAHLMRYLTLDEVVERYR